MRALRSFLVAAVAALALLPQLAQSAGVIPFALTQQIDRNGRPLVGCLFYVFQVGTTATPQQIWQDFGLTIPLPNPLTCDDTGRLPSFYLADGQVHVRLTDSGGLPLVDIPVLQVVGPSGGGGGGAGVDPNAIATTGDIKFRQSSEVVPGWVKLNSQTIGSALSGATGRANNDTQALFIYLWTNCPDVKCPVSTGRGASGLADFNANKTLGLPDWRGRQGLGRDQMEASITAGRIAASSVTSGGGDTPDTPGAFGGECCHVQTLGELVQHLHNNTLTDPTHFHFAGGTTATENAVHNHNYGGSTDAAFTGIGVTGGAFSGYAGGGGLGAATGGGGASTFTVSDPTHAHTYNGVTATENQLHAHTFGVFTDSKLSGVTITNANQGSSVAANVLDPFILGSWYMRL